MTRRVAAFDFDGTLSRRDTLIPFLARVAGRRALLAAFSRAAGGSPSTLRDRDAVKERVLRSLLAGREQSELERLGRDYAAELQRTQLRPGVQQRLREHVDRGDTTLFVSASLVYYLRPLAESLGVDEVIAVEPSTSAGRLTGGLEHPNVRAEQKALRLREWLGQPSSGPLDGVEVWGYGNSSGDYALLAMSDHAYWLGKPAKVPPGSIVFEPTPLA